MTRELSIAAGVHVGDARELDGFLRRVSGGDKPFLTTTVTSPPYGDLKDYGDDRQIGWGQTFEDYLSDCRGVFRDVAAFTKPDGSMWLVVDSYRVPPDTEGKPWRLEPLPFTLARIAEEEGWTLRDVIVWHKNKTLPWSSRGRLRNAFEHVLYLVKSDQFKYRIDRIRDRDELEEWWVRWPERYSPKGKVPTNVWSIPIPVQGSWREPLMEHSCPLAPELVERILQLSTDPGDVVLDPFAGTGVVVGVAESLGRLGVGLELRQDYVDSYASVVRPALRSSVGGDANAAAAYASWLEDTIKSLRALKFSKVLVKGTRTGDEIGDVQAVVCEVDLRRRVTAPSVVAARVVVGVAGDSARANEVLTTLKARADRPPLSKFGVDASITIAPVDECCRDFSGRRLWLYENGVTWSAQRQTNPEQYLRQPDKNPRPKVRERRPTPPIFSNVRLQEEPRKLRRS